MLKVRYAQSIRYAYKNRASYNMIAFLFSSSDFNEAIRRLKYLKKYRDYRKEQAEQIRFTQTKIERKIGELNSVKSQKDILRMAEEQQRLAVQKEANETDKVVRELKGRERELANDIAKNQKSLRQLERTIQNLIQREIELARKKAEEEERRRRDEENRRMMAANNNRGTSGISVSGSVPGGTSGVSSSNKAPASVSASKEQPRPIAANVPRPSYSLSLTPEVSALSDNFESNRGRLPWPVEKGFVAERFGVNKHPLYNIQTENSGIEIQTAPNASARAVFNGTVKNIFYVPGMGQCVLVDHGRFFTVYSRLGNVSVSKGQTVSMKQTLGTVGPNDSGEYLMHFELWKVGANDRSAAQNPEAWIAR